MATTPPNRRRVRALAQPLALVLVCALALPQALARSAGAKPESARGSARAASVEPRATGGVRAPAAEPAATRVLARAGVPVADGGRLAGDRVLAAIAGRARARLAAAARRRAALPPAAVRRVIAAGNRIARAPYQYGGGHGGGWESAGYDCSGSISYALHGGGLLDAPLASGGFMSWGAAGPGRWITIYASPGHAFMVVAGRRFDTTGREQSGSRWQRDMRSPAGYVVRHPPGL